MNLPTVPTQDEYCLTPEQLAAWRELARGMRYLANKVDRFLEAHPPPKQQQKKERGNE